MPQDPGVGQVAEGARRTDAGAEQEPGVLPPDAPEVGGIEGLEQDVRLRMIDERKDPFEPGVPLGELRSGFGERTRDADADRDRDADPPPDGGAEAAAGRLVRVARIETQEGFIDRLYR